MEIRRVNLSAHHSPVSRDRLRGRHTTSAHPSRLNLSTLQGMLGQKLFSAEFGWGSAGGSHLETMSLESV